MNFLKHIQFAAAVAIALFFPTVSLAGAMPATPTTSFVENEDTTLFAGISLVFGPGGQGVEGVLGVAHGDIDLDGDVTGAKASMHFGFSDGLSFDKVKLTALFGEDSLQAEVGGGYSFKTSQPFAVIGANGAYAALGADIFFDGPLEGYVTLHTIGKLSLDSATGPVMTPVLGEELVIESPIVE